MSPAAGMLNSVTCQSDMNNAWWKALELQLCSAPAVCLPTLLRGIVEIKETIGLNCFWPTSVGISKEKVSCIFRAQRTKILGPM